VRARAFAICRAAMAATISSGDADTSTSKPVADMEEIEGT
jgi:hypothetical protein